jgi:SNF2 family DNA or RNA helicase
MPISQEKIDAFLNYVPDEPRPVKGVIQDVLLDRIWCGSRHYISKGPDPWPHQLEALTFCLEQERALLLIKVRRGKTKISLDWLTQLYNANKINRALVIVPQPIVLEVWRNEVPRHSNLTVAIARTREDLHNDTYHSDADIVVVHWGTLLSYAKHGKTKGKIDSTYLIALRQQFQAGIIDESHKCKNHTTARFQMASILFENMKYRLGLTGTPFARNQFNLWAQMYLIDGGKALGHNYYFFEEAFGVRKASPFGQRRGMVWSKRHQKHIMAKYELVFDESKSDLLWRKMCRNVISYGWEGAEHLPELIHNMVDIPMSPSQKELYNDQIKNVIDREGRVLREQRDNTFTALRQIATGSLKFVDHDGEAHTINADTSAKMDWLVEFLEEVRDTAKIVIVHEFIRSGELIVDTIRELVSRKQDPIKLRHAHIKGGTKDAAEYLKAFMEKRLDILVINWRSVSMGVDLSVADYQLFVETPVSSIDRVQVEARAVANRQGRPLFLDDLICAPVERKILLGLKEGKDKLGDLVYQDDTFEMVEE